MIAVEAAIPGPAPAELEELQERFTRLLRMPLLFGPAGARADTSRYDAELVAALRAGPRASAGASLSVYHRQYWLRLFDVMQREFALSARLIGLPRFYALAQAFLLQTPPRDQDLGRAADGFAAWCASHPHLTDELARELPSQLLPQALSVDAAWRRIWSAVALPPFAPNPEQASALPQQQLTFAPTAALVTEDWPLVSLRRGLTLDARADRIGSPLRLDTTQHWLLLRTPQGIGQMRLSSLQSRLYLLCGDHRLADAVEQLHAECAPGDRAGLPARVRDWLAQSMELKLWVAPC